MTKSTLARLREEERETRKDIIVDAAVKLFASKSFNQVGMREIASEAGMSPASIYRYFSDRDDLFLEALIRESQEMGTELEAVYAGSHKADLEELARFFVTYLLERSAFFQMMVHFMVDGGIQPRALEKFNQIERRLIDSFEAQFKKLGGPDNVRLLAHAFFASLSGILIAFWNYPGRDPQETRRHMLRLAALVAQTFRKSIV